MSKDQKRIIISSVGYAVLMAVATAVINAFKGRFSLGESLLYLVVFVVVCALMGCFLALGSKVPKDKDK